LASLTRWLDEAFAGQPRLVTVYGETGTGTAMLMRQLESEVRVRGGLFAMAASTNQDVPQPYGVWSELLRATNRVARFTNVHFLRFTGLLGVMQEPESNPQTHFKTQRVGANSRWARRPTGQAGRLSYPGSELR
jgi:hypothetical protein